MAKKKAAQKSSKAIKPKANTQRRGSVEGGAGGKPTSKSEKLFRLRVVETALLEGKRGTEIVEALAARGRVVPWNTIRTYIHQVREKWEREDEQVRPVLRAMQLRSLHKVVNDLEAELRAKADSRPTWNVWLGIQKLIAEIEGNLAPEQLETMKRDDFEGWTLEELEHYIKTCEEPKWYRLGQPPPTDDQDISAL